MFRGLLRYGRPAPDYTRSNTTQVVVRLSTAEADLPFLEMILNAERGGGGPLPVDTLIALSLLRAERRADQGRIAQAIQKDDNSARRVLETLVEQGYIEAHGVKKGRTYTLSASVYRQLGQPHAYVRQAGFDAIQHEQMMLQYAKQHGEVRRKDVMELCRVSGPQATRLLGRLESNALLVRNGSGRGVFYRLARKK
jgi:ATP-dependent DNA helicase RecG